MHVSVRASMLLALALLVVPVIRTASAATITASPVLNQTSTSPFANLKASAVSSSAIDLAWTDMYPTTGTYGVDRSPDDNTWTVLTTTMPVGTETYTDTGLIAGTKYSYRVGVHTLDGRSGSSNSATATTLSSISTPTPTDTSTPTPTVTSASTTVPTPRATATDTAIATATSTGAGAFPPDSVAYIGCSNTAMSVNGYTTIANTNGAFWSGYNTDSGTVNEWADASTTFWTSFKQLYSANKTSLKAVWVELCEQYMKSPATYAEVQAEFANLRAAAPGLKYYVSGINLYNPTTLCGMMGPDAQGITDTNAWATEAVKDGLALPGPSMGPLEASTTLTDGCHPNTAGESILGQQLATFFG